MVGPKRERPRWYVGIWGWSRAGYTHSFILPQPARDTGPGVRDRIRERADDRLRRGTDTGSGSAPRRDSSEARAAKARECGRVGGLTRRFGPARGNGGS
jgi:hypothetical protein